MGQQLNRTRQYVGMTACALGTLSALMAPVSAFATTTTEVTGNEGTTEVTVKAAEGNIVFEVPTVIPFAAGGDGSLIVPEDETIQIVNKSIFGISVTNMKVKAEANWNLVSDATDSDADNSIDFQIGPSLNMKDASAAATEKGTSLKSDASWNMGYEGSGNNILALSAAGNVAHVVEDLSAENGSKVATITWTVAAGQNHA